MSNNSFTFIGNLVQDSELKTVSTGLQILNFRLAISDGYGDKKFTDYHTIKGFGKTAEYNSSLKKGDRILVMGRVKSNSADKDGKKTYFTDFIADRIYRIAKVAGDEIGQAPGKAQNDFDDLPFWGSRWNHSTSKF